MIGTPRRRAAIGAVLLMAVLGVVAVLGEDAQEPRGTPAGDNSDEMDSDEQAGEEKGATIGTDPAARELPDRGEHPPLLDIDGWLQSGVTSLEELRGNVVAVQFWTFGCRNCRNTLPHMRELHEKYGDEGFEIVGVHAPEFDFEADLDNIEEAAAELGVTWPIVLDTNKRTFHSWQEGPTGYWPRLYLLDRNGHIRYDRRGEGRYDEIDHAVQSLLAET